MVRLVALFLLIACAAQAAPATTQAPTTLLVTQCSSSQFLLGGGAGLPPSCSGVTLALMPVQAANTVLGALTSTTPSALPMPSCSGSSNALIWTSGTGFGCNTLSTGGSSVGTLNLATYAGVVVGSGQTLAVRQANCTNINAAITSAETSGLEVDVPIGVYEISCSGGLLVPATSAGFKWRGNRQGSVFVQYYTTSPGQNTVRIMWPPSPMSRRRRGAPSPQGR